MKKFLTAVRLLASAFGVGAVIYLSNQGELGVNLTTIMSTASPIVVIIVTYMFDVLKYVIPATVVKLVISNATKTLGQENTDFLVKLVNEIGAPKLVELIQNGWADIQQLKETVTLIRQDQVDNG